MVLRLLEEAFASQKTESRHDPQITQKNTQITGPPLTSSPPLKNFKLPVPPENEETFIYLLKTFGHRIKNISLK